MLSTFFKIYIRAKLPFRFFGGVIEDEWGQREGGGLVKMGERGVRAEKNGIKYQPRFFSINPTKDYPREPQSRVKNGVMISLSDGISLDLPSAARWKSTPLGFFKWSNGYLRCSRVP